MVKTGTELPGQSYPERDPEKKPEHAGQVFAEVYAAAVKHMHPEDAVGVAEEAAVNFLESIGATKPSTEHVDDAGMRVKIVNSRELAGEIAEMLFGADLRNVVDAEDAAAYRLVKAFRYRPDGLMDALAIANVPHAPAGAQHTYFVEIHDGSSVSPFDQAVMTANKLAGIRDGKADRVAETSGGEAVGS